MVRISYLLLVLANGRHVSLAETATTSSVRTIKLGMDKNYPPYAMATEDGELDGFAVDFAHGMNAICPNVQVEMVYEPWGNCWKDSDGGKIGKAIEDGTVDACTSYLHTHIRNGKHSCSL